MCMNRARLKSTTVTRNMYGDLMKTNYYLYQRKSRFNLYDWLFLAHLHEIKRSIHSILLYNLNDFFHYSLSLCVFNFTNSLLDSQAHTSSLLSWRLFRLNVFEFKTNYLWFVPLNAFGGCLTHFYSTVYV